MASRDHPRAECDKSRKKGPSCPCRLKCEKPKGTRTASFLFFINEPVGMYYSAADLNGSCCVSKSTATSQQCSNLVCQGTEKGTEQSEGHLLHPPGPQSADFLPGSCLTHPPPTKHGTGGSPWEPLSPPIILGVRIPSASLLTGLNDTQRVTLSPWPNNFESLFWF